MEVKPIVTEMHSEVKIRETVIFLRSVLHATHDLNLAELLDCRRKRTFW